MKILRRRQEAEISTDSNGKKSIGEIASRTLAGLVGSNVVGAVVNALVEGEYGSIIASAGILTSLGYLGVECILNSDTVFDHPDLRATGPVVMDVVAPNQTA